LSRAYIITDVYVCTSTSNEAHRIYRFWLDVHSMQLKGEGYLDEMKYNLRK